MSLNVLITGANNGVGLLTPAPLPPAGHTVHAGPRHPARGAGPGRLGGGGVWGGRGGFPTSWGAIVFGGRAYDGASPYRPIAARFNAAMADFRSGPPQQPQEVADAIVAAALDPDPKLRHLA